MLINAPGAEVQFFSKADEGLLEVIFDLDGNNYDFNFLGPQIYSGNTAPFSLLTGTFLATSGTVRLNNSTLYQLSGGTSVPRRRHAAGSRTFCF